MKGLDQTVQRLGDGQILRLKSGKTIFKLYSYPGNPIIRPQDLGLIWQKDGREKIGAVFNPGAVLFNDSIILTPRCHINYEKVESFNEKLGNRQVEFQNYISEIWPLSSRDGLNFERFGSIIKGDATQHKEFTYGIEDIRVTRYKDGHLLVGCGKIRPPFKGKDADRVAIYTTRDFKQITYHGIIDFFDNRDAVPLILSENQVYMLLRFLPHIYIAPLKAGIEQILRPKDYKKEWIKIYENKDKFLLLKAGEFPHESEKIGPGPPLIRTDAGWLLIYHAVGRIDPEICEEYGLQSGINSGYSICAALLDAENPRKIICRTKIPLYIPSRPYELWGNQDFPVDIPAVVFPTGIILRNNKLLFYCGAGDKYVILLSCNIELLLDYMLDR